MRQQFVIEDPDMEVDLPRYQKPDLDKAAMAITVDSEAATRAIVSMTRDERAFVLSELARIQRSVDRVREVIKAMTITGVEHGN